MTIVTVDIKNNRRLVLKKPRTSLALFLRLSYQTVLVVTEMHRNNECRIQPQLLCSPAIISSKLWVNTFAQVHILHISPASQVVNQRRIDTNNVGSNSGQLSSLAKVPVKVFHICVTAIGFQIHFHCKGAILCPIPRGHKSGIVLAGKEMMSRIN